ncbi:MAG: chromate transporter, chromate ion transporter family [Rhodocyclales bacterium]|nr:chromate transporter, chromate ion transporter family [Rhodocyclales bacterium]
MCRAAEDSRLQWPYTARMNASPPSSVSFRQALLFWLKLGFISFGGPAGQISIMHQELVERRCWISEKRFLHALNYCMVLPGPEAQQLATYIGWLMHRTWGGIVAGALFVLPSLLILIILSWTYIAFGEVPLVAGLFYGIKPAVTAIVVQAAHRIGSRALKNKVLWAIAAASFVAIFALNVPFPAIVAAAALIGYIGGRVMPAKFKTGGGHGKAGKDYGPALIDDETPTPPHARFSWARLGHVGVAGAILWAIPMAFLTLTYGWNHTLTQMGWFFTKAALLTFGGAYAVLPYVYQGAVGHYGWLTPTQMIDGLALGETTPGPLIMIVAFVGFVGAYVKTIFGADMMFLAGAVAASLVTWFTFLPSFIFILAGGPLVETTHNDLKFTAPLTAITAAVVGVIMNLALFFGYHVLWPKGFGGGGVIGALHRLDWVSALIALAAAVALLRFKYNVIHVIGACALIGLLLKTYLV